MSLENVVVLTREQVEDNYIQEVREAVSLISRGNSKSDATIVKLLLEANNKYDHDIKEVFLRGIYE